MLIFFVIIIFISIIFYPKSILTKKYLMSHILDMLFNTLLNYVLLFLTTHGVIK
jgi:hypothetical protein